MRETLILIFFGPTTHGPRLSLSVTVALFLRCISQGLRARKFSIAKQIDEHLLISRAAHVISDRFEEAGACSVSTSRDVRRRRCVENANGQLGGDLRDACTYITLYTYARSLLGARV